MTFFFTYLDVSDKVFGSLLILITLVNCGALLEQRNWIYYLEVIRLLLFTGYLSLLFETNSILALAILSVGFLMGAQRVQRWYLQLVYDNDN
jgi:hypothetical protein